MRRHSPDFFIHSGDQIYADNPIVREVKTDDGNVVWVTADVHYPAAFRYMPDRA